MIVVVSRSETTRLARPSWLSSTDSELNPEILGNWLPASEHRHIFQHGLAPIAEAWCLNGDAPEDAAQLIDDEGSEGFSLNVLGHEQDGLAALGHLLQKRKEIFQIPDLAIAQEDIAHPQEPPPSSLHR